MGAKRMAGRSHRSESEWRAILGQFERSGQSQLAFCRQAGLSPSTFQVWRHRLRLQSSATEFIDVTPVVSAPASRWSIEIEFPDGTTTRVRG